MCVCVCVCVCVCMAMKKKKEETRTEDEDKVITRRKKSNRNQTQQQQKIGENKKSTKSELSLDSRELIYFNLRVDPEKRRDAQNAGEKEKVK